MFNKDLEFLKKQLNKIDNFLKSKILLCSAYAYQYEKTNNLEQYLKFENLWNGFSNSEKEKVITYFYSFNECEMLKKLSINREDDSKVQQKISEFIIEKALSTKEKTKLKIKK